MKFAMSMIVLVILGVALAKPDLYTTKYDNIDLDEVIKSHRLLKNYMDCLLDFINCSPDGAELKRTLPDALLTDCTKCSQKQKDGSKKIITHLIKNKPDWWKKLEEKYDHDGTYRNRHKAELDAL